jgi:SAM-dependent methyltransferase
VLSRSDRPTVLVIGSGVEGVGFEYARSQAAIQFIETDVSFGPRIELICDAHNLPLCNASVDGVIAQAVLEHVVDPQRCVAEMHRVLRSDGVIYAETPFMQQVHGGRYDFTRFTQLGHRRLFRHFSELSGGVCMGPGSALAWCCQYFLLSFFMSSVLRVAVKVFCRLCLFWLKYFDAFLASKPAATDAASGFYFMGAKAIDAISDRAMLQQYRGAAHI